MEASLVVL